MAKHIIINESNAEIFNKAAKEQVIGGSTYQRVLADAAAEGIKRWDYEPNEKYLIFIPGSVVLNELGEVIGTNDQMPINSAHVVDLKEGKRFTKIRTTEGMQGLLEDYGISGVSPLTELAKKDTELFFNKVNIAALEGGIDLDTLEGEARTKFFKGMFNEHPKVTQDPELYIAFPIVHIRTVKDSHGVFTLNPAMVTRVDANGEVILDADGNEAKTVDYSVEWYVVKQATFNSLFTEIQDNLKLTMGQEDVSLANRFYVFSYAIKEGTPDAQRKMLAGQSLKITDMTAPATPVYGSLVEPLIKKANELGYKVGAAQSHLPEFAIYSDKDTEGLITHYTQAVDRGLTETGPQLEMLQKGDIASLGAAAGDVNEEIALEVDGGIALNADTGISLE